VCGVITQTISQECGQEIEKDWRDALGKKDAALVEAALFSAALGGSCKFMSLGIHDIGWNRFEEASGVVLFGLSCGKMAWDAAFL